MFTLENDSLRVRILDPVSDRGRMGARYCTGGYVFQIDDDHGALLSGPTYPDDFNWFDGQGIPDSFALSPLRDPHDPGTSALIPGIGLCDTKAREVTDHCEWRVDVQASQIRFTTRHAWSGYALSIERVVSLAGRVVRSETTVGNEGAEYVPLRWFPHPFYPLPQGDLCSLPGPVALPAGTTYSVADSGFLRCSDPKKAQAVPVTCASGGPLSIVQRHPRLGLVAARYSFAAGHVLVWGNTRTFSFEPYLERTVGPQCRLGWTAEYIF